MCFPTSGSQPVMFLTPSNNLSSGTDVSVPFTGEELNSIRLPFSKRILGLEHLSFSAAAIFLRSSDSVKSPSSSFPEL